MNKRKLLQIINILFIGIVLIMLVIAVKYKVVYKVEIEGESEIYVVNKEIIGEYNYEVKLVSRINDINLIKSSQELENIVSLANSIEQEKFYEITSLNNTVCQVNDINQAEGIINIIKESFSAEEVDKLDLMIIEKYGQKSDIVPYDDEIYVEKILEMAKDQTKKEEEAKIAKLPNINGVAITNTPVIGTITSRYGEYSRIRTSLHTGLDIAASVGTDIRAVSSGTVTFASYSGAYGNKIVINHGSGVETMYAHASKIDVEIGQSVEGGEKIGEVGSTGNSTGPHLHLEIIQDGVTLDPEDYLYSE